MLQSDCLIVVTYIHSISLYHIAWQCLKMHLSSITVYFRRKYMPLTRLSPPYPKLCQNEPRLIWTANPEAMSCEYLLSCTQSSPGTHTDCIIQQSWAIRIVSLITKWSATVIKIVIVVTIIRVAKVDTPGYTGLFKYKIHTMPKMGTIVIQLTSVRRDFHWRRIEGEMSNMHLFWCVYNTN